MTRGIIALVFLCKMPAGLWRLAANDEIAAFRWADEAEVADLADEAYAIRVLDAMRGPQPTAVRAHDGMRLLTPDHAQS